MIDRDKFYSEEKMEEMKTRFETLLESTNREGMDKLINFIRKSDFYTAPASTRFHNAVRGGLLSHSLNVYDMLKKKFDGTWPNTEAPVELPDESIIITALLHDFCKVLYYKENTKNAKHYEPEVVEEQKRMGNYSKRDAMGEFVWVTERGYEVDDQVPYGHGEKSVMMIESYIKLKGVERYMIRWHMGFSEPKENWPMLSTAMDKYPQVLAIFEADMEASHLLDAREK